MFPFTQIQPVHADHTTASPTYVAPELSQVDRVKICDFPSSTGRQNIIVPGTAVDFTIVKNGAPGNIAVHVIPPSGGADPKRSMAADVVELSADNYLVHIPVLESGTYRVHIRFNDVELPASPLTFKSVLPVVI